MRKTITLVFALACTCLLGGCVASGNSFASYRPPVRPPQGFLFTHIRAPLATEFSGDLAWERKGSATAFYVGWWIYSIALGDCSMEAAAKKGGVRRISYADYKFTSVFWVFRRFTVQVYGDGAAGVRVGAPESLAVKASQAAGLRATGG